MSKCKCCPGVYRTTTKDCTIKTRIEEKKVVVIEDLDTNQCTICGHQEFTDDSLQSIRIIKEHLLREVSEHRNKNVLPQPSKRTFSTLLKFFSSK